jgi:hypothetical protein
LPAVLIVDAGEIVLEKRIVLEAFQQERRELCE